MTARIAAIIFAALIAHAPSASADTNLDDTTAVTAADTLPQIDHRDVRYRVRPQPFFPEPLRDYIRTLPLAPGQQVTVSCKIGQRFGADGRLQEITVSECDEQIVEMIYPELERRWKRARIKLTDDTPDGAWVRYTVRWRM